MPTRFQAGSDIAMIGAWDGSRTAVPLGRTSKLDEALEADAREGHLFLVYTGGDGEGPVDVYVNEPLPGTIAKSVTPLGGEFLLRLPTGSLVVDGIEAYRAAGSPGGTTLPAGDYAVTCYRGPDEKDASGAEERLRARVDADSIRYYDRTNLNTFLTVVIVNVLLAAAYMYRLDWKLGLVCAVVTFVASFHVVERLLRRNRRYQALNDVIPKVRLEAQAPTVVLELRSIADPAGLRGGSVRL